LLYLLTRRGGKWRETSSYTYVSFSTPSRPYHSSVSLLPSPRLAIGISSLSTLSSPQAPPFETDTDKQFYTISSGFRLRTPMPPYLPPAERSRQRLVEGIRGLDVVKRRSVRGGGRHLLFFAYALAMQVGLLPRLLHPHLLHPHLLSPHHLMS